LTKAVGTELPSVYYLDGAPGLASARYRVFNAIEQLRVAGVHTFLLPVDYDPATPFDDHNGGPGVLVIHRAQWDERLALLITAARARGIRVLYDIDDLVFEPVAMPWIRALTRLAAAERDQYEDEVRRRLRALKSCDAVLTTTDALGCYAAAEGLPVFVHRNALDKRTVDAAREVRNTRPIREEVILYYGAGSGTHDVDFQVCGLALERVLEKHRSVRLLTQGEIRLSYALEQFGNRIERLPWMPWPDYLQGIARADINLAPLELGNPFCEAKSELKWFEAGIMAIPTVASATDAFREVIRPCRNGFLADSSERWFDILDELITQPDLRDAVGSEAEADVTSRYQSPEMGQRLADLLTRIARASDLSELDGAVTSKAIVSQEDRSPSLYQKGSTSTTSKARPRALNGTYRSLEELVPDVVCLREDGKLNGPQPPEEIAQVFRCLEANMSAIGVKVAQDRRRKACSWNCPCMTTTQPPSSHRHGNPLFEAQKAAGSFSNSHPSRTQQERPIDSSSRLQKKDPRLPVRSITQVIASIRTTISL
jgi:glycosyltransferase involved in cell wall biosynthesis